MNGFYMGTNREGQQKQNERILLDWGAKEIEWLMTNMRSTKISRWLLGLFILALAGSTALFTGCKSAASGEPAGAQAQKYTCPMDPEVVTSTPGKCPKCGMDLVEKK